MSLSKHLIRYGDVLQLDTLHLPGHALAAAVDAMPDGEGNLPLHAEPLSERGEPRAAWRVVHPDPIKNRLGLPVAVGDLVRLRHLGSGPEERYLKALPGRASACGDGAAVVAGPTGADPDYCGWYLQYAAGNSLGEPVVGWDGDAGGSGMDQRLALQLNQPTSSSVLLICPRQDGRRDVDLKAKAPDLSKRAWTARVRAELEPDLPAREIEADLRERAWSPELIYEHVAPQALERAQNWRKAGGDPARVPSERRALLKPLRVSLPDGSGLAALVETLWRNAVELDQALAANDGARAAEVKSRLHADLVSQCVELARPETTRREREAARAKYLDALKRLGASQADQDAFRTASAALLGDRLPSLDKGSIHLPGGARQRRRDPRPGDPVIDIPEAGEMPLWLDIMIGFASFANPMVGPILNGSRLVAHVLGITVGVGQEYQAGAGGGGSLGFGICVLRNGRLGFYGSISAVAGMVASLSATWQWTFVHGGIEAFGGQAIVAAVGGGEVVVVNGGLLYVRQPDGTNKLIGATAGFGLGIGAPIEFYMQYVSTETS